MKKIIALTATLVGISLPAVAGDYVHGYTTHNGTYVQPYTRSFRDGTVTDNFSYHGNTNPYTGSTGTNSYHHDLSSPNYMGPGTGGYVGHSGSSGISGE